MPFAPWPETRACLTLPRQVVWQDCEVGAIFHFDIPLFAKGGRTNHNAIHQTWDPKINTEHKIEPLDRLVKFYYQSVGRNCNLVLGLTPDPSGLLPEPDFNRCAEFGAEIRRRFRQAIAETNGKGEQLTLELPGPQKIDHVVIMEDITAGERVRSYTVEGRIPGENWRKLCEGFSISIGHKHIQQFTPIEIAAVRLSVTDSVATPLIRNLVLYHVG